MGNQQHQRAVAGPNTPWEDPNAASPSVSLSREQLAEFHTVMRPLTHLDHEVSGRASLLPDGTSQVLRPTFILHGYPGEGQLTPETVDAVTSGRADCMFHVHPGSMNYMDEEGSDCWPSVPDLVFRVTDE